MADDISSVAKKGVVTTEEIERMLKDASANLSKLKPVGLKRLGIDKIALIKGQGKYCQGKRISESIVGYRFLRMDISENI